MANHRIDIMKASHYFDIEVRKGGDLNTPHVHTLALKHLHASGVPFAMGFPKMNGNYFGSVLRVFSESGVALEGIQDHLKSTPLDDYVKVRRIMEVPTTGISSWERYDMVRFKSIERRARRYESKGEGPYSHEMSVIRMIEEQKKMLDNTPFLEIYAYSTRQNFRLYIRRSACDSSLDGKTNSYGLSSASEGRSVALPVIPES